MADFLKQPPIVPLSELPAKSECAICLLPYDTVASKDDETLDNHVRLSVSFPFFLHTTRNPPFQKPSEENYATYP